MIMIVEMKSLRLNSTMINQFYFLLRGKYSQFFYINILQDKARCSRKGLFDKNADICILLCVQYFRKIRIYFCTFRTSLPLSTLNDNCLIYVVDINREKVVKGNKRMDMGTNV